MRVKKENQIIDGRESKSCSTCGVIQSVDEFHKLNVSSTGYAYICKGCKKVQAVTYRKEHPDEVKAYSTKYRQKNAARIKEVRAKWESENAVRLKASNVKWRQENKERIKAYSTNLENRFIAAKKASIRRGICWELSLQEWSLLTIDSLCHYCGGPLNSSGSGLDRMDNSIGYVILNVVCCCRSCNSTKGSYHPYDLMVILGQAIREYRDTH